MGAFEIKGPGRYRLRILSSGPAGNAEARVSAEIASWEHVSVSVAGHPNLTPSWEEMDFVRHLFWRGDECILQFHPPTDKHISMAEVLHLWKPPYPTPLPPASTIA